MRNLFVNPKPQELDEAIRKINYQNYLKKCIQPHCTHDAVICTRCFKREKDRIIGIIKDAKQKVPKETQEEAILDIILQEVEEHV